jgi:glycosyltransferase involved in cell wall biosynthesis
MRPRKSLRALRRGRSIRELLRFALWLDTARFFGVTTLREPDMSLSVLSDLLPLRRWSRRAISNPRMTAVIITQNRSQRLRAALTDVKRVASSVIVIDGGSEDDTEAVVHEANAILVRRPFDQNFAAQRNAGLRRVGKAVDWVLRIDDDESFSPGFVEELRNVAAAARGFDAIVVPSHSFSPRRWPAPATVIVAIRPSLRYRGRVHEKPTWKRPLFLPLSSPALENHKTYRETLESALLYSTLKPADFPPGFKDSTARLLAELDDPLTPD